VRLKRKREGLNLAMDIKSEWIAVYAAIVSTGALFLGVIRWVEAGPRLRITLIPDGMTIGGGPDVDEEDLILVTVTNKGEAATMITNLQLFEFRSWLHRLRRRPMRSFVIPNPQLKGYPPSVPTLLEPGRFWTGAIRKRTALIEDLHTGRFYVGVSMTHYVRPWLRRIPKRRK
jgi:hypothetical protein